MKSRQHNYSVCSIYFCNMFQPQSAILRLKYFEKRVKRFYTIALWSFIEIYVACCRRSVSLMGVCSVMLLEIGLYANESYPCTVLLYYAIST
jgi:hypothetical protein